MNITIDGKSYEVAHQFNENRVLINYDGLYVFADRNMFGNWDLSGLPAREDEKPILKAFLEPTLDKTVVTVTKEDE